MMSENHIEKLITSAVDAMKYTDWTWPRGWNKKMKIQFINDTNEWLLEREMYEQCEILQSLLDEL